MTNLACEKGKLANVDRDIATRNERIIEQEKLCDIERHGRHGEGEMNLLRLINNTQQLILSHRESLVQNIREMTQDE
jgi:hypothetical protein